MPFVHKTKQGFFFCFVLFISFCAWCRIWKGRPVAVVSSGSIHDVGGSNLGKKAFSRGRSEIQGWKLGQKGPLLSPRYHFLSGRHQTRPCVWIFGPCFTRLLFCLFCRQSWTPTSLVFACPPPHLIWLFSPAGACLDSRVRQNRHQNPRPLPKPRSPRSAVFTHFSDAALLRRVSSRTPCFVYSETERRLREPDERNSCWQQRLQSTVFKYSRIKAICPRVRVCCCFLFFFFFFTPSWRDRSSFQSHIRDQSRLQG